MRYKQYNPDQMMLLPPSFQDLIAPDSPVWLIIELINEKAVKGLETSKSEEGNAAYNPLMMTRLIVWAYSQKLHSSRQIQRSTHKDVEVMYLCDMQHPDFRTICNFRRKHSEFLSSMYKKIYRTAYEMKLTGMFSLSVDGAHIKGNVSGKKGCKRIKKWKEIEKELDSKIAEYEKAGEEVDSREDRHIGRENGIGLSEEYTDVKRRRDKIREVLKKLEGEDEETKINLTDPDARYMKKGQNGQFTMGYNMGIVVDENQMIADISLTNNSSDQPGLKKGIAGVENTIDKEIPKGTKVFTDAGYFSADNIDYLKNKELDGYIAPSKDFKTEKFEREWQDRNFKYDENKDVLICRYGRELERHQIKKPRVQSPKISEVKFRAKEKCTDCPYKNECCKQGHKKYISMRPGFETRNCMTEKMLIGDNKELYKIRKTTVEPCIGDIKWNLGVNHMNLRGFAAKVEPGLAALWHNMKLFKKLLMKKLAKIDLLGVDRMKICLS